MSSLPDAAQTTDPLSLAGRAAFVTGGSRGIGLACARALAQRGADIAISGSADPDGLQAKAAELADEFGVTAIGLVCDNAEPSQIPAAYKTIRSELGRLDVLVNNAGIMEGALIGMIGNDVLRRTMAINVEGAIAHLQAAAKLLRRAKGGSIINLTSILGVEGRAGQTVYAASKAAVIGATKSAAKELAGEQIRVNAVAPGFISTDLTAALDEAEREATVEAIAMGRAGTPEDVADTVLYLASDLSKYVTGQVIGVDGGMRA
ncbi:SDR family NAD(P)-dependent oxidoreductase [Epidermidibacterium keratini]|uniref:SDR family NAD(P)-dependent oxidoreductase n=1 Tax=Epidermidibacterium keratini TaxID=1891644 RepID=UPI001CEF74D7|nr:glucose 1-dehydrogenase [Epidermidibacterium keratini]